MFRDAWKAAHALTDGNERERKLRELHYVKANTVSFTWVGDEFLPNPDTCLTLGITTETPAA